MSYRSTYKETIERAKLKVIADKQVNLMVVRKWFTSESSIGTLYINDIPFCYTLEDFTRPDGEKVYGETAIPYGNYNVKLTYSPRFKRILPLIENVFNYTGIRIHPGNDASNTLGCILVGLDKGENKILNSKLAFDTLFTLLDFAQKNNYPIKIKVTNFERQFTLVGGAILSFLLIILIGFKYVS